MGSNFYIADARQLSNGLRDRLKEERGEALGFHKRKKSFDSLYLVGKRHATGSIDEISLDGLTADEITLIEDDKIKYPHFTLTLSREIFNQLNGDTKLYSTGAPLDIPTVAVLRERMSTPGYRVEYIPNENIG